MENKLINSGCCNTLNRKLYFIIFLLLSVSVVSSTAFAQRTTEQITTNMFEDTDPKIADSGYVTFTDSVYTAVYNGVSYKRMMVGGIPQIHPNINNYESVVWVSRGGNDLDIYLSADGRIYGINGSIADESSYPIINDSGWIAWKFQACSWRYDESPPYAWCEYWTQRYTGTEVHVLEYSGTRVADPETPPILPDPDINNKGEVVWMSSPFFRDVFFNNGYQTSQIIDHNTFEVALNGGPKINENSHMVWSGGYRVPGEPAPRSDDIYLYDGVTRRRITDSGAEDHKNWYPQINNLDHLVWARKDSYIDQHFNIFFYDGTSVHQLTDNEDSPYTSTAPKINDDDQIVWQSFDGNDYEIFLKEGSHIIQLTDNAMDDIAPEINNRGEVVWQSFDGHDYEIFISRPDREPENQWAKTFGGMNTDMGQSVTPTDDGGYIVAGTTYSFGAGDSDFWVLKLDGNGAPQWQKSYGGGNYDTPTSIQQTVDGGYIVGGKTESFGSNGDVWLLKLQADGAVHWQKHYGGSESDVATALQQTYDNGYIVAGKTGEGIYGDVWLLRLDEDGNAVTAPPGIWQKGYASGTSSSGEYAASVKQTGDNGFIAAGTTYAAGADNVDFWVIKIDANGATQWEKTYGGTDIDIATSVQKTGDAGYIVAGHSFSFNLVGSSFDVWVVKLDGDGNISWQKAYGTAQNDYASSIVQITGDGSYVVTGNTCGSGAGAPCDGWIMKLGVGGKILWQRAYGGPDSSLSDSLSSIKETSDDGFIAAGATQSFGFGDADLWVLKLDHNGEINGCSAIKSWSAVSDVTSVVPDDTSAVVTDTEIAANDSGATEHVVSASEGDGCNQLSDIINLPKTGQTTIYYPGDDGALRAGVTWPSLRFHDNRDGTVTDRLTGLMWLRDANYAQTTGHDPNATGDGTMNWEQALDFISGINEGSYEDWRLPNINELGSLTNLGQSELATWLMGQGFEHVQSGSHGYWSCTTHISHDYGALQLTMTDGDYAWKWKTSSHYVWAVRSGQQDYPDPTYPAKVWKTGQTATYYSGDDGDLQYGISWPVPRFSDHGDGTVTDNLTGLMWLKDADCFSTLDLETTYETIVDFNLNPELYACTDPTADYDDWRLSNRKELLSLIDRSQAIPPLPAGHPFANINPGQYRSSSTYAESDWKEWQVDMFYYGMPTYSDRSSKPFWPVRGGKHGSICSADLDADRDVDGVDLAVFLADYLNPACDTGEVCDGDFDSDGDVDDEDLNRIALELGTTDCLQ